MAAFGALNSLEHVVSRHIFEYPGYLPPPENNIMKLALEQIVSTLEVLEILDNDLLKVMKKRSWELVEAHVQKRFPCEYARFACIDGIDVASLRRFMQDTEVDASDIGRIRSDARRLQHLLQSLLQQQPLILAEQLDTAKHQILCFIQNVEKIKKEEVGRKSKHMVRLHVELRVVYDLTEITIWERKAIKALEVAVRRLDVSRSNRSRMRVNDLEIAIREKACELEDLLEPPLFSNQFPMPFPLDQHEVIKYIPPFTLCLRMLEQEYIKEVISPLPEKDGDDDNMVSSIKLYGKTKSKMVGLNDEVEKIKTCFGKLDKLEIVALFGMAGIGKTTIAKQVFEDHSILGHFELRVWVEVGQNYQIKRIKQIILSQVLVSQLGNIDEILTKGGDEGLDEYLHQSLKGRKYLIVLDDVWEDNFWDRMIKRLFPDDNNGSRVLLTTRRRMTSTNRHRIIRIRFLSKEESWILLHEKVFGEEALSSPLLENAGRKIAKSCEGLPLTIITIGKILSKVDKTLEKWKELADNPNSLIKHAYDVMSDVLLPSYTYLSQKLKAIFLYMGVFPCKYEISKSELFKLWVVEKMGREYMGIAFRIQILEGNSLLMKRQKRFTGGIKTWCLHSSFWHLCKGEGMKHKFSYAIGCLGDSLLGGIKNQRRLCIHRNILFGIKDAHKSMSSISTARSLLCTGPPHQYPVPICFDLKLLRILNALRIRLYEFPMDLLKLFRLRYLSLTCYGNLPSSISKLWNLEILIVRRHLSMGSSKSPSYLPVEIWDMNQLKHLEIMGSDLPSPCEGTFLPNLQTLLDVSNHSCNKCVFEGTPNLEKLGVRIELRHNDHATETSRCFDHIQHLKKLVSLKCVVANPTFDPHVAKTPLSVFPSTLENLSLSGFGYLWEDMRLIASLPNLRKLKLRCYAFRGPKLEIKDNGFPELWYLLIEDTDLMNWTVEKGSLRYLRKLSLKSCYNLENITNDNDCSTTIVDCFKLKSTRFFANP